MTASHPGSVPGAVPAGMGQARPAGRQADMDLDLDDLTRRAPGQAVMAEALRLQAAAPPRSRAARVFGANAISPDARSWYRGALGERITARLLDALGPEYVVLHSVPVAASGTDIDHIVIGPIGILTINTKHLHDAKVWVAGDTVLVSGRREQFVRAARSERSRVVRMLSGLTLPVVPVTTVVAVLDAAKLTVREAPADVSVVDARRLVRMIARMPHVLEHDAVWALAGALSSGATWTDAHGPADPDGDPSVVTRFAALEREVRVARAARLAWAAGACAALAGGIVVLAASMPMIVAGAFGS